MNMKPFRTVLVEVDNNNGEHSYSWARVISFRALQFFQWDPKRSGYGAIANIDYFRDKCHKTRLHAHFKWKQNRISQTTLILCDILNVFK